MAKRVKQASLLNTATSTAPSGPRWQFRSRGVLLLVMLLLPLAGAVLYAGPAWAQVCYQLITEGGLLLLWLAGASGWGLFLLRMTKSWERETPGALQWATAAALGLGMESLAILGLGLAGWLNGLCAWALIVCGVAVGGFTVRRWQRQTGTGALELWFKEPAGWEWLWLMAAPFMMIALASAMAPPGMLWNPGEPHGYDVVEYHLQVPREWYEAGRIIRLHHNVFSYFPFNVEMHYLLAMHLRNGPWAGMYLAQLMHVAFIALTVLAVYGFAARGAPPMLDGSPAPTSRSALPTPAPAVIAGLSVLAVPWLTQLAGIAYDEGGFLLFGALAIGWALAATFDTEKRTRRFALAGAMAGMAAGSKLTAVPEVLVAVPVVVVGAALWLFLRQRDHAAGKQVFAGAMIFAVTGLLCFSPWLLRNQAWAHNPVFPELMPILGHGDFNDRQVQRWKAAHEPRPDQQTFGSRVDAFRKAVIGVRVGPSVRISVEADAWQFGYLLLPVSLIAFGLSIRRPQSWCLMALLLMLMVFWLGFTHLQGRFFLLAAPLAAMLIGQAATDCRVPDAFRKTLCAVVVGSISIAWWNTHREFLGKLYGSATNETAIAPALGLEKLDGLVLEQDAVMGLPDDITLVLIGDARAFWYPLPMSRLKYRTVFDVKGDADDAGPIRWRGHSATIDAAGDLGEPIPLAGFVKAWTGEDFTSPGRWLLIDPEEIRRLCRTYKDLPEIPKSVSNMPGLTVIKR